MDISNITASSSIGRADRKHTAASPGNIRGATAEGSNQNGEKTTTTTNKKRMNSTSNNRNSTTGNNNNNTNRVSSVVPHGDAHAVTPANSASVIDEMSLIRSANHYEEEQRKKNVQWFRSVGANPTSEEERAEVLKKRQSLASEVAKNARELDRSRISVENQQPLPSHLLLVAADPEKKGGGGKDQASSFGLNISPRRGDRDSGAVPAKRRERGEGGGIVGPAAIPLDVIASVVNGTFPHDDNLAIDASVGLRNTAGSGKTSVSDNATHPTDSKNANSAALGTSTTTTSKKATSSSVPPRQTQADGLVNAMSPTSPSRKDLILGKTSGMSGAIDALTRAAHQATMVANAQASVAAAASAGGPSNAHQPGRSASISPSATARAGTPTKRGSTPPNIGHGNSAGSAPVNNANLNAAAAALMLNDLNSRVGAAASGGIMTTSSPANPAGLGTHGDKEDPIVASRRQKAASEMETDALLRLALGGDLFVGSEVSAQRSNGQPLSPTQQQTAATRSPSSSSKTGANSNNMNTSNNIPNPAAAASASSTAQFAAAGGFTLGSLTSLTPQQMSDPYAIAAAATNGLTFGADGSVTTPQQLITLREDEARTEAFAGRVKTVINSLVAHGVVAGGTAGAGLEARRALREKFELISRILLLRARFDRRAALALRAIQQQKQQQQQVSNAGGGGQLTAFDSSIVPNQGMGGFGGSSKPRGVEFARQVVLVEMPSLLPPTGDNPLSAVVPQGQGGAGNKSGASAGNTSLSSTSALQSTDGAHGGGDGLIGVGGTRVSGTTPSSSAGAGGPPLSKAAAKAAAAAQAQAQALQQQLAQQQQQIERQAVMTKLAPAPIIVDPRDPNSLSLLGERLSSASEMRVLEPKKAYTPFGFKHKGYRPFPLPPSALLNASPVSTVAVLPAGPAAVPETKTIVPALEHFAQPIPTLETFPLPRNSLCQFTGVSLSETLLNFDQALYAYAPLQSTATVTDREGEFAGGHTDSCHSRSRATAAAASALALHTLAPMPFSPSFNNGHNASGGGGGFKSLGLGLDSNMLAYVNMQHQHQQGKERGKIQPSSSSPISSMGDEKNKGAVAVSSVSFSSAARTSLDSHQRKAQQDEEHGKKKRRRAQGKARGGRKNNTKNDAKLVRGEGGKLVTFARFGIDSANSTCSSDGEDAAIPVNHTKYRKSSQASGRLEDDEQYSVPSSAITTNRTLSQLLAPTGSLGAQQQALPSFSSALPASTTKTAEQYVSNEKSTQSSKKNPSRARVGAALTAKVGSGVPRRMQHADPRDDISDDDGDEDEEEFANNTNTNRIQTKLPTTASGGGGGLFGFGGESDEDEDDDDTSRVFWGARDGGGGESVQPTVGNNASSDAKGKGGRGGNTSPSRAASSSSIGGTGSSSIPMASPSGPCTTALANAPPHLSFLSGIAPCLHPPAPKKPHAALSSANKLTALLTGTSASSAPSAPPSPTAASKARGPSPSAVFGAASAALASGEGLSPSSAAVSSAVFTKPQLTIIASVATALNDTSSGGTANNAPTSSGVNTNGAAIGAFTLSTQQQAEIVADSVLYEEAALFESAPEAGDAENPFVDHRRAHVGATNSLRSRNSKGAQQLTTTSSIYPYPHTSTNPMLDTRLSFLMSAQLHGSLPTDAYAAIRPWVPVPNGGRDDNGSGNARSHFTGGGGVPRYSRGSNGPSETSSLSSVANTLQRLAVSSAGGSGSALLPFGR